MLCQPKWSGGASRSATRVHRMGVMMLCEFQVSGHPLVIPSVRPPLSFFRATPLVISTERKRAEKSVALCAWFSAPAPTRFPLASHSLPSHVPFAKLPHIDPHLEAFRGHLMCAEGRNRPVAHRDHRHGAQEPCFGAAVWRRTRTAEDGDGGRGRRTGTEDGAEGWEGESCPAGEK